MRISAIAILVALFLWPAAVFGQSPELMDAYNRGNELSAEGRPLKRFTFQRVTTFSLALRLALWVKQNR